MIMASNLIFAFASCSDQFALFHRYTYFPSSRRQFGLLGPSLLEIDHDERPEDGTLASSLAVRPLLVLILAILV